MSHGHRILLCLWDGGGLVPPALELARRLVARGHLLTVLADPTVEAEARAAGADFRPWVRAPHRRSRDRDADILKDYAEKDRMKFFREQFAGYFFTPGEEWMADVLDAIDGTGAELVLSDFALVYAALAAEERGVPCVSFFTMPYALPRPGMTPPGAAMLPVPGWLAGPRNALFRWLMRWLYGQFTAPVAKVAEAHHLAPVVHAMDPTQRAAAQLVLTARAFDFDGVGAPPTVHWTGPMLVDPAWSRPWVSPWPADDPRPLVLVGLSTTFQDQAGTLRRLVEVLARLPVRAVVTLGPTLAPSEVPAQGDVCVVPSAPHTELLQQAAVVVTHCGHGTTLKALAAGVPMLCLPMGRDQDDNAARVKALGAGLVRKPSADAPTLEAALGRLLAEPAFRAAARSVAARIGAREGEQDPVVVVEGLLGPKRAALAG